METARFLGIALVVGVIAPLFWLGVNCLENYGKRLLNERKAKKAAAANGSFLK